MNKEKRDEIVFIGLSVVVIFSLVAGYGIYSGKPLGSVLLSSIITCAAIFLVPILPTYVKRFSRVRNFQKLVSRIFNAVIVYLLPEGYNAWDRNGLLRIIVLLGAIITLSTFGSGLTDIFWGLIASVIFGFIIWAFMSLMDSAEDKRKQRKQKKQARKLQVQ